MREDYRPEEYRGEYFDALYTLNLQHGIMPGCVYLYFPGLKHALGWDDETCLWFAFLNGMTQNPLTSLRLFEQIPEPPDVVQISKFSTWFDSNWSSLQFDTDRRYAKKDTVKAIVSYTRELANHGGSQVAMLDGRKYHDLWVLVENRFFTFGRLSTFSYLEYLTIFGHGTECIDLMFHDVSGSKSHRNGMLFLMGQDPLVHDKRAKNGFDGEYIDFFKMCGWLAKKANERLARYRLENPDVPHANLFTFESQLCQFKNNFFGRRYPGVYADMGYERLCWYHKHMGKDRHMELILDIRTALPDWLRLEAHNDGLTIEKRAAIFPKTGVPYRAEYFL